MTDFDERWDSWVQGLAAGDRQVLYQFWEEYGQRLNRLAEKHLHQRLQRRVGPEDVVQSACRTFFRRVMAGEFNLPDSESLWSLMCAITLTKLRQHVRFHHRQRRAVQQEEQRELTMDADAPGLAAAGMDPTPQEAAQFAEQLEALLNGLDQEEQHLVELKLAQCTNQEAANRLGCSERTVRRILKRVQLHFRQILDESCD